MLPTVRVGRDERREVLAEALLEGRGVPVAVDDHRGLALDERAEDIRLRQHVLVRAAALRKRHPLVHLRDDLRRGPRQLAHVEPAPLRRREDADHLVAEVVERIELRTERLGVGPVDHRRDALGLQLRAGGVELRPRARHLRDAGLLEERLVVEADVELVLEGHHEKALRGVEVDRHVGRAVDLRDLRRREVRLQVQQELLVLEVEEARPLHGEVRPGAGDRRGLEQGEVVVCGLADHLDRDVRVGLLERGDEVLRRDRVALRAVVVPERERDGAVPRARRAERHAPERHDGAERGDPDDEPSHRASFASRSICRHPMTPSAAGCGTPSPGAPGSDWTSSGRRRASHSRAAAARCTFSRAIAHASPTRCAPAG